MLGEIVISGGGVSEGGDDSIVLRNVNAPKLIVDNIPNQQISIRVEGDGVIEHTSVRTTPIWTTAPPAGYGLSRIALEGEDAFPLTWRAMSRRSRPDAQVPYWRRQRTCWIPSTWTEKAQRIRP